MKAWSGEVAHVKRCYTRGIPGRGCSSPWRTAGTAQSALGNLAWLYERQQRERESRQRYQGMYNFVGIREKRPGKVKARLHALALLLPLAEKRKESG